MEFGKYFAPMLLSERSKPFDDEKFIYEIKFDGIRATVHVSPTEIVIYSRNGTNLLATFPELESLRSLVDKKTIFDGEIVALKDGIPNFEFLQKRSMLKSQNKIIQTMKKIPVIFVAFDCLYYGEPLTEETLIDRKKVLEKFKENEIFTKTVYTFKEGKKMYKKVCTKNLEGIVAKNIESLYFPETRTADWIKIKNYQEGTFYIGGYIDNEVKSSLLLGEYRDKKFYYVGKISIERNTELYKKITKKRRKETSSFVNYNKKEAFYLFPNLTCQVRFIERTDKGNLRHPILKK